MPPVPEDDTSSLERAREHLYKNAGGRHTHPLLAETEQRALPHTWKRSDVRPQPLRTVRPIRLASVFLIGALLFFLVSASIAGYFFYFGGNSVSVDKIAVDILGPTTIAGGDVVPLSITITNRNVVAIQNATIAIDFPSGTRDAADVLKTYPHYIENVGTLESGASITRSVKAVIFGGAGQKLVLPISVSYGTDGSNARFMKNTSYEVLVSATPLSVTANALTETVSGQPFTFTLTVSSNATVPIDNVVLTGAFPFGFTVTSSSRPLNNSSFLLGTLMPGAQVTTTLTGTLVGQDNEQRVFHFTVGTAATARDQTLAISYMTEDTAVTIAAPFINTTLALNGDTSPNVVMAPDSFQNVSLSYTNTLPTNITNATISITVSGTGVDYDSIKVTNGFYNSINHTIVFSKDANPSLAVLAPGASGIGTFSFKTTPASALASAPTILFTTAVSGTRIGQTNVPSHVSASSVKTAKIMTSVVLSVSTLYASGSLSNSGPIPPRVDEATTYTIVWTAQNKGSAVAGGIVSADLPSYVSYTDRTRGAGSFSYNDASHTVTWDIGDLAQGASAQGFFQVSLTPSISQKGNIVSLTRAASFSGYDRFAGIQIETTATSATTEMKGDAGYTLNDAVVQ